MVDIDLEISKIRFWKQTMDSLHFNIFHIFHVGLRTLKGIENEYQLSSSENKENEYFDHDFAIKRKILAQTDKNTIIMIIQQLWTHYLII